jgi:hypothetical protein
MLTGMEYTARLFVLSFLAGCGVVHLGDDGPPDAGPLPDAALPDAANADAGPRPDGGGPCNERFDFADLAPGFLGEMALLDSLGTLEAEQCANGTCEPARLYASDFGLGVEGSRVGGDGISGLDRVTLQLPAPARVEYRIHAGINNNTHPGVHHRVTAYMGTELVHDQITDAIEYEAFDMPLADLVIWSSVLVEVDERSFADNFAIDWVRVCQREPVRTRRSTWP